MVNCENCEITIEFEGCEEEDLKIEGAVLCMDCWDKVTQLEKMYEEQMK